MLICLGMGHHTTHQRVAHGADDRSDDVLNHVLDHLLVSGKVGVHLVSMRSHHGLEQLHGFGLSFAIGHLVPEVQGVQNVPVA